MRKLTNTGYEFSKEGLEKKVVPCRRCGDPLTIYIQKSDVKYKHVKYCVECKRIMSLPWADLSSCYIQDVVKLVMRNHRFDGPVSIFKPGDDGFEERAAEYLQDRQEVK